MQLKKTTKNNLKWLTRQSASQKSICSCCQNTVIVATWLLIQASMWRQTFTSTKWILSTRKGVMRSPTLFRILSFDDLTEHAEQLSSTTLDKFLPSTKGYLPCVKVACSGAQIRGEALHLRVHSFKKQSHVYSHNSRYVPFDPPCKSCVWCMKARIRKSEILFYLFTF